MKALVLAASLGLALQALPAVMTPPAAEAEAPAAIRVPAGGDLQDAINRSKPGDIIELPAGASFTGNYLLPERSGARYTTIRTARVPELPGPSERIDPASSGKLARIQSPNSSPVFRTAPGAHHWRLLLLEIGPTASPSADIIVLGDGTASQSGDRLPRDLIVDRCYIHGDPERGQKRGIALNSAATTVTGSYISDIKSANQDAQAIAGWSGPGPFLIENNYLEASGENFILGGAIPAVSGLVPSDLVFRRNHVTRPPSWRSEKWTVKNLFELKNARRVLVEGNLFENNWVDGQAGYAIVFTPRGENGRAPWATIEDVTFRYNVIRNVAAAFNLLGRDDTGASGTMRRVRIADNLVYRVDRSAWGGNGLFLLIGDGPAEVMIEHNTILQSGSVLMAYGGSASARTPIERFVYRNNLAPHNANGIIGQGQAVGSDSLEAFFPGAVVQKNVFAGGRANRYPADNFFPELDSFTSQFVNYANGDYRLRPGSEFSRAATDGTDLGVNYLELARAMGARAREWLSLGN